MIRRFATAAGFVILALGSASVSAGRSLPEGISEAPDPSFESVEARETLLDLLSTAAILRAYRAHDPRWPASADPSDPIPLASDVTRTLPPEFGDRVIARDAWGHPVRIAVSAESRGLWLLSVGADGASNADVSSLADRRAEFGDDIVVSIDGEIFHGPESTSKRMARTMASLRAIGAAVEAFAIYEHRLVAHQDGVVPVERLRGELEPTYVENLPTHDAWGHPLVYFSNGASYVIVSTGGDGRFEPELPMITSILLFPERLEVGSFSDPSGDLVFVHGEFLRWFEGVRP